MGLVNRLKLLFVLATGIGLFGIVGFASQQLEAQSSIIRTILCDANSTPLLTIHQPQSDSIVDLPLVDLSGSTERTTQIEIFVNDNYSHSVAVEPGGNFATNVPLSKGINTIKLESYFSCNQQTSTDIIVITYEPKAQPSEGSDTDTGVKDQPGTAVVTPNGSVELVDRDNNQSEAEDEKPDFYQKLKKKLTIQPADDQSESTFSRIINPAINWFGTIILLTLIIAFGFPAVALSAVGVKSQSKIFGVAAARFIRFVAGLLTILVLLALLIL